MGVLGSGRVSSDLGLSCTKPNLIEFEQILTRHRLERMIESNRSSSQRVAVRLVDVRDLENEEDLA